MSFIRGRLNAFVEHGACPLPAIRKCPLLGGIAQLHVLCSFQSVPWIVSFIERLSAFGRVHYWRLHCKDILLIKRGVGGISGHF